MDSVAFRYLAAGNDPDFRTINDFRKRHERALSGLFEQVLTICRESGPRKPYCTRRTMREAPVAVKRWPQPWGQFGLGSMKMSMERESPMALAIMRRVPLG